MRQKDIFILIFGLFISTILFLPNPFFISAQWQEPTEAPPGGNVFAPINVGNDNQAKQGWLSIAQTRPPQFPLDVDGDVRLRTRVGVGQTNPLDNAVLAVSGYNPLKTLSTSIGLHSLGGITGIYGAGPQVGVEGESAGIAVSGQNDAGARGQLGLQNQGVYGEGPEGIRGIGLTSIGVYGGGVQVGVEGESGGIAVAGYNDAGPTGQLGLTGTGVFGQGTLGVHGLTQATATFPDQASAVRADAPNAYGVYATGLKSGVAAQNYLTASQGQLATQNAGVYGYTSGDLTGVYGLSQTGTGVWGVSQIGNSPGVLGESENVGVVGTGNTEGVLGRGAVGVRGEDSANDYQGFLGGANYGARGRIDADNEGYLGYLGSGNAGYGAYGRGNSAGVWGQSGNTGVSGEGGSVGVLGRGPDGVIGENEANDYYGILGRVNAGVYGQTTANNFGYLGYISGDNKNYGVYGQASDQGVRGIGGLQGVFGYTESDDIINGASAVRADAPSAYGVYATGDHAAVRGENRYQPIRGDLGTPREGVYGSYNEGGTGHYAIGRVGYWENSASLYGLYGDSDLRGVYGRGNEGVRGENRTDTTNYGVVGGSDYGVYGQVDASNYGRLGYQKTGVYGQGANEGVRGVNQTNTRNIGLLGSTQSGVSGQGLDGVVGQGDNRGVIGLTSGGIQPGGAGGVGVYGSGSGYGVYAASPGIGVYTSGSLYGLFSLGNQYTQGNNSLSGNLSVGGSATVQKLTTLNGQVVANKRVDFNGPIYANNQSTFNNAATFNNNVSIEGRGSVSSVTNGPNNVKVITGTNQLTGTSGIGCIKSYLFPEQFSGTPVVFIQPNLYYTTPQNFSAEVYSQSTATFSVRVNDLSGNTLPDHCGGALNVPFTWYAIGPD